MRSLLSTAASVALHGGMALAFVQTSGVYGLARAPSESISLETVETVVVEAVVDTSLPAPQANSVAQTAAVAAQDTPEVPPPPVPVPIAEQPVIPDQSKIEPEPSMAAQLPLVDNGTVAMLPSQPIAAPVDRSERIEEAAREQRQQDVERERRREAERRQAAQQAQAARVASANAHGREDKGTASSRATASQGDMLGYAAMVRARVASNKPSGLRHRGTAVISFGISGSGSVTFASLSQSSGSSRLDQAAVIAVRNAGPFSAPPDKTAKAFTIPFHFQ